jgi:iron complex outermembrane receptor protein
MTLFALQNSIKRRLSISIVVMGFIFLYSLAIGQTSYKFSGIVLDEKGQPLQGATVSIPSLHKGSVTDINGSFSISNLNNSAIHVDISFSGYKTLHKVLSLTETSDYTFKLEPATVKLHEVVVSDNYAETKKKESALNVEIVNEEFVKQNLGGSLMKSLERLPGVSAIEIGSGNSKPVIRGLGFNRVVVVENNIKHEAQQWGADHGLEIDQYAVDNIEVIKGPASLMYGSDAIGGIIDLKNRSLPAENTFGATIDLSGKTNNDFLGTSISAFVRKKDFYITARATVVGYGDYRVPTDSVAIYSYLVPLHDNFLRNTAGNENNLHTSFGVVKERFQSKFNVSNVRNSSGIFANAHGLEPRNVDEAEHDQSSRDILQPFKKVNHFKVINRSTYWADKWNLEVDLGFQRNDREEWSVYTQHGYMPAVFPEDQTFEEELERQFKKDIYSLNAKAFYNLSDKTEFSTGLNAEQMNNTIDGRGFIIPAFNRFSLGGFAFANHSFSEESSVQMGIRYDFGHINTQSHFDWFSSPTDAGTLENAQRAEEINRSFSNFTWSLGYVFNPQKWSYKVNVGKSFRMPIAKELAANGINYHRFSYEVGNANLSPEISYQLDAGIEYSSRRFAIGATPFVNYFTNYIYLNPTARFDRLYGFGNQVFEYTESEVFRFGGEIHTHYEILSTLQVGFIGEYVYAEQMSGDKKGYTLPFAPPASGVFNIKYQQAHIKWVDNAYASLDYRITAAQRNIVPPEVMTEGFQLLNLRLGGDVMVHHQEVDFAIQIQNLLNTKYFNHTSFYRLINVPEAGRNIIVNVTIPIKGKINAT